MVVDEASSNVSCGFSREEKVEILPYRAAPAESVLNRASNGDWIGARL